jgi:lysozyme
LGGEKGSEVILGAAGKALIQSFEKLALESYQDQGGVWTIGWGHTGKDVGPGQTCTPQQADAWFAADTAGVCRAINQTVTVPLRQNQFDALVAFTYNVGAGNEAHSTLLRLLNAGDYGGAADQFPVWNKVNGRVSNGLVARRAAEQRLFLAV